MFRKLTLFSVNHPRIIIVLTALVTIFALIQFPRIKIDTDPENMLSQKEFVRKFHDGVKKEFSLYDFVILGIVNDRDPDGVFNPGTMDKIYAITKKIEKIVNLNLLNI